MDQKRDEQPLAVVVKKPGKDVTPGGLRELLRAHFAKWQMPDGFAFVEA